jgi:hypothetical protein
MSERDKTMKRIVAAAVLACGLAQTTAASPQAGLVIGVLEGEGSFNDIKRGIGRAPVVEVKDEAGRPVENAKVTFQLPDMGPSGTFGDGSRSVIVTTDKDGRATARGLRPNSIEGRFAILVTASEGGRTGRAEIMETNTLAGGDASMRSAGHGKLAAFLVTIAGAAAGGIFAATRGGSSSSTPAPPTPTTLTTGTVSVGGPR